MKLHLPPPFLAALLTAFCSVSSVTLAAPEIVTDANGYKTATYSDKEATNSIDVSVYTANDTIVFQLPKGVDGNYFANEYMITAASVIIGDGSETNKDTLGLIIQNGYAKSVEFSGKVTGSGTIHRSGKGNGSSIIFSGDVTDYTGDIYIGTDSNVSFTLIFGGKDTAVAASTTYAEAKYDAVSGAYLGAGIAGTGGITFGSATSKLVFNYSASENPVYITNAIAESDGVTGSTLTLKGGASYKFTKDVYVDNLTLEGGSALTISGGKVNSLVGTNGGMVNVTGGEVILAGQANAIGSAGLTISNATVSASANLSNQSIIHKDATVNINAGGKLELKGHDVVGWNGGQNAAEFILAGESKDKLAKLDIVETGDGTTTLGTLITMKGHTLFSGTKLNTWGAAFTVEGTNNTVDVDGLFLRKELNIKIESGGELTLAGSLDAHSEAANANNKGSITKTGAGLLNLTASLSENFALPITIAEGGLSSDYFGVVLTEGSNDDKAARKNLIFNTAEDDAVIKTTDAGYILLKTDEYTLADGGHVLQKNYKVDGDFSIDGAGDDYDGGKRTFTVGADKKFSVTEALNVVSRAELLIDGGSVIAGSMSLGHEENDGSGQRTYQGYLSMASGSLTTGTISLKRSFANVVNINGGSLEFTSANAINRGSNTASTINITGTSAAAPVVLKATTTDWTLDGSGLTTAPTLGNIQIDAANTHAITLKNVSLSGSVVGNGKFTLGGAIASDDVVLDGALTLDNVTFSGDKVTLQEGARATVANMSDISSLLPQLTGTGTLVLASDAFIAGEGASTANTKNPNTTVYDFAGNIEVTGGVLKLADDRGSGDSYMNSLSLANATITLNGGSLRYFGGNSTLGCVDVDANATLEVYATNGGASVSGTLTIKELDIASGKTLTLNGQWAKNVAIDVLTGQGELLINARADDVINIGDLEINTVEASAGIINIAAGDHEVKVLDVSSSSANSTANINLKENAHLDVKTTLWMGAKSSINLEDGATLTKGVVNVEGLSTEDKATLKKTTTGGDTYSADKAGFTITGAEVTVTSNAKQTLANKLSDSQIVNAGAGELKLTHADNVLTGIKAMAGNISFEALKDQTLESLYIAEGKTVNVGEATLSIQEAATTNGTKVTNVTFGNGAKLQGNLVLQSGASVSLGSGVEVVGTLTLGYGMELTGAQLEAIENLKNNADERVALFSNVDALRLADAATFSTNSVAVDYTGAQDLSNFFSNVDNGVYLLEFDQNVVYATLIPEPTTTTLSLLTLAALAARRRRR